MTWTAPVGDVGAEDVGVKALSTWLAIEFDRP
jgi:hypothetical protein